MMRLKIQRLSFWGMWISILPVLVIAVTQLLGGHNMMSELGIASGIAFCVGMVYLCTLRSDQNGNPL